MPAIPLQLTMAPCRSEYDSLLTSWSTNDCPDVSLFGVCATRGWSLIEFLRLDHVRRMELDGCCGICIDVE
jgi:hypothetical protein